jgi:hypothetical protein
MFNAIQIQARVGASNCGCQVLTSTRVGGYYFFLFFKFVMKAKLICLEENLDKFGYKLDMKVIFKNNPSVFLNTYNNLYYKCQYNLYYIC